VGVEGLPMFAPAPWRQVRTADPESSHETVARNQSGLALQRLEVLVALRLLGRHGGTIYEVAARGRRLGYTWDHVAAARRLYEAGELGEAAVRPDPRRPGKQERRESPNNVGTCRVWVHARYAREAA
jgi:hypothetical protein